MANQDSHRSVSITRTSPDHYRVVNVRGGEITISRDGTDFTPVELLLAAVGGCTAIDVDILTSRRSEPDSFEIEVAAEKVRDESGNRLTDIEVTFRVSFPHGEAGDAARKVLPEAVARSHDFLCTVSRTLEMGSPVGVKIES
jgi:putative redox protein